MTALTYREHVVLARLYNPLMTVSVDDAGMVTLCEFVNGHDVARERFNPVLSEGQFASVLFAFFDSGPDHQADAGVCQAMRESDLGRGLRRRLHVLRAIAEAMS